MKELSLDECSKMVDRAINRDRTISPTVAKMLEQCDQPVKGTTVMSTIVCVLQDYNRDELLEIVAVGLFFRIHSSKQMTGFLKELMKELGINPPPPTE
jgi:hypothetical protein